MSALETLDGLANGTDIGIQTGGRGVDRWRVADGGLETGCGWTRGCSPAT